MTNEIEIVVKGSNTSNNMFEQINRSVGQAKRNATAAWKEFDVLGVAAELAAHEIGKLQSTLDDLNANQARQVRDALTDISTATPVATAAVRTTADAVDDIGDQARRSSRDVDGLGEKLRDLPTGGGGGAGGGAGRGVVSGILGGLASIPGHLTGAISDGLAQSSGIVGKFFSASGPVGVGIAAGLGLLVSTAVGTAIAGTGLAAVAGGGIAAGIAGAARDQRVIAAAGALKDTIGSELSNIGTPFIRPLVSAMQMLSSGVGKLGLAEAFAPLASTIKPIAAGLLSMAREAMPGIREMAAAAVPVVMQLVDDMPELGRAVGDFAKSLAAAGPGAAKLFHTLISGFEILLNVMGPSIEASGKFLDLIGTGLEKIGVLNFDDAKGKVDDFSASSSSAFSVMSESVKETYNDLQTLKEAMDALSGATISSMEAESAYQEAIDLATESIRNNGATLDLNSQKGRDNQSALLGIVKASQDAAQAIYDETWATQGETAAQEAAMAAWNRGRGELVSLAQGMGLSAAQAEALANKIMGIPNFKNVRVSVDTSAAEQALARVRSQIAALPSVNTAELQNYYGSIPAPGRARGGPVEANKAYVVGENRPELFIPAEDGMIYPEVPTKGQHTPWNGAPGYAMTAPNIININVSSLDPSGAAEAVMSAIQRWERRNGAGWRQ